MENISDKHNLLDSLTMLAQNNSQISSSNKFNDMTDYQKIMMSYVSYIPIFLGEKNYNNPAPTINDLFLATLDDNKEYQINDYLNFYPDAQTITDISNKFSENREYSKEELDEQRRYFNLLLGKLILQGYGNLRIEESHQNNRNGFSAVVLSDGIGDSLVYFPCTDFADPHDILYDAGKNYGIRKVVKTVYGVDVFTEQQKAAERLVKKYISKIDKEKLNSPSNKKVHIGGYSLGGSLGEHAYYKSYNYSRHDSIGEMFLLNPLHTEINSDIFLKAKDKIKIYATKGDIAHKAFNFKSAKLYDTKTTIIPIDINNELTKEGINKANSYSNFVGQLMNKVVGYTDQKVMEKTGHQFKLFNRLYTDGNPTAQDELIRGTLLRKFGFLVPFNVDVNNVTSLQEVEVALSTIHQQSYIEYYKQDAFNSNGSVVPGATDLSIEETLKQIHDVSEDKENRRIAQ